MVVEYAGYVEDRRLTLWPSSREVAINELLGRAASELLPSHSPQAVEREGV